MAGLNGLVIVNGGHVNFVDTDRTSKATVVAVVLSSGWLWRRVAVHGYGGRSAPSIAIPLLSRKESRETERKLTRKGRLRAKKWVAAASLSQSPPSTSLHLGFC